MQREGSPWRGLGVVTRKELSDHLSSVRMLVIELLVVVTGVVIVLVSLQQIRDVTAEDPFLLLRVFTRSGEQLSFVFVMTLLVPLVAIGLGLRSREQRAQSAHAEPDPVAADLPGRAAVRQIPGGARDHRHQSHGDVDGGARAGPGRARRSAERGGARARGPHARRDHRLRRRLACAGDVVLDPVPLAGDRRAQRTGVVALRLHPVAAAVAVSGQHLCPGLGDVARRTAQRALHPPGFQATVARSLVRRDRDGAARSRRCARPSSRSSRRWGSPWSSPVRSPVRRCRCCKAC